MFFVSSDTRIKVDVHLPVRPEVSQATAEIIQHALGSIVQISRTFKGESNTDVSEDKPPLLVKGEELSKQVADNYFNTLRMLLSYPEIEIDSVSKVAQLIGVIGLRLNDKIAEVTRNFWRTWETPYDQTLPENLKQEFREVFCHEFVRRFQNQGTDPIEFAYWIEQYCNTRLHPLNDGCGRLTKVLAAWILGRSGLKCARFNTREEYFNSLLAADGYSVYRSNVLRQNSE